MALWGLDLAFADVVSTSSDPALGAIRLAWWRERLDQLDETGEVPAEPRLQAIAKHLNPCGIKGLSRLEDGWLPLLDPFPWGMEQVEALKLRGAILFGTGACLLGSDAEVRACGALWSLVDGARHCSDPASRELLLEHARALVDDIPAKMPPRVRCLTILGALASAELFHVGDAARRLLAALGHRLFGTVPRS